MMWIIVFVCSNAVYIWLNVVTAVCQLLINGYVMLLRNYNRICFKKLGLTKMGKPLIFWKKLTLPLDSQPQCFQFSVPLLWRCDCRNGWVLQKPILHNKKYYILGVGLKASAPKYQNWSNKSFCLCASSGVLTIYGAKKKKYVSTSIGNSSCQ